MMANYINHLLIYLLTIHVSSFMKWLLSCVPTFYCVLIFLLLGYRVGCFSYSGYQCSFQIYVSWNIFSQSVAWWFIFFMILFSDGTFAFCESLISILFSPLQSLLSWAVIRKNIFKTLQVILTCSQFVSGTSNQNAQQGRTD